MDYRINFRYKNLTQSALFFAYKMCRKVSGFIYI